MDTRTFKDIIAVIRAEKNRRNESLRVQRPDVANDRWLFVDKPFLNELCLMLLVRLSHQVERELLLLVERMPKDKREEISAAAYRIDVEEKRNLLRREKRGGWEKVYRELGVGNEPKSLTVLRLLTDSYKHDPFMLPDNKLLKLLNLPKQKDLLKREPSSCAHGVLYAPLSESDLLQEGLAALFHLGKNTDYCDIAEQFVDFVDTLLAGLKSGVMLPFKQELVPLDDFER